MNQSHLNGRQRSGKAVNHENFLYMRAAPVLSWRLDPDDSLSDWTLRISSSENPHANRFADSSKNSFSMSPPGSAQTKTYFVHRTNLAVGPRRSEYFAKLFKTSESDQRQVDDARDDESNHTVPRNVTKVELLPSAASCFPVMLDYLYSIPGTPLDISTKNAVALRHLASSFGIKSLFNETTEFIKEDLTPETAPIYLVAAKSFKNEKLASTAINAIAKNFKAVKLTALSSLPPQFLIDIVQSGHLHTNGSEAFSSKIAAYCRCRPEEITFHVLESLTSPKLMPTIAEEESLYYLQLLVSLGVENDPSLFDRCLEQAPKLLKKVMNQTMSLNGAGKAAFRLQETNQDFYHTLPDSIKVQLLEKLSESQEQPVQPTEEKISKTTTGEKRAKKQAMRMKAEMDTMKTTYDKKLEYLKHKLEKKEEELMKVSQQDERQTSSKARPISRYI